MDVNEGDVSVAMFASHCVDAAVSGGRAANDAALGSEWRSRG